MNLASLVSDLKSVDSTLTIVAKRPWTGGSDAQLVSLTDNGRVPSNVLREGFFYLLEVSIALDEVLGELVNHLSLDQQVAAIIYYAENDAYPGWLNTIARQLRG